MTIDLQIAIIEKIKKIKQKKKEIGECADLPSYAPFRRCFLFKFKKKNAQRCSIGGVKYL